MDTKESSAPHAHPSTEEHDDTVEAHYSGPERLRPCACMNGTVFIGHLVVGDDSEEVEVVDAVLCGRCAAVDHSGGCSKRLENSQTIVETRAARLFSK